MAINDPPCLYGFKKHDFPLGSRRVCSRCWWAPNALLELALLPPARTRLTALEKVLLRWGDKCVYCGGQATTRDHLIPDSRGGSNGLENLRPACEPCNQAKGDRTPFEWLGEDCDSEFKYLSAPRGPQRTKHKVYDLIPTEQLRALAALKETLS